MGLLGKLFGRDQPEEETARYSEIGNVDALCPYCDTALEKKPTRKKKCPHCGDYIYVKKRPLDMERVLVTADQRDTLEQEWSDRHIRKQWASEWVEAYDEATVALEKQFGFAPPLADVFWRVLDQKVFSQTMEGERWFLGHEALYIIRQLRMKGELDTAEDVLRRAEPTPAVADELRKTLSARARLAKKQEDWQGVVHHLESYVDYADKWRQHCLDLVKQEPPPLTDRDKRSLEQAREHV